jgi:ribonucleoside-diphosphate reductase alpha chain
VEKASSLRKIIKRDGRIVDFKPEKIQNAVYRALNEIDEELWENNSAIAKRIADQVAKKLEEKFQVETPSVEDVQDLVEETLMENDLPKVAKAYILYRQKRTKLRNTKIALGIVDDLKLPINSVVVLAKRYLQRDERRNIVETPKQLFRRIAHTIASVEKEYGKTGEEVKELEEKYYDMMTKLEFLPNSPTLMNAGTDLGQLSACFVLPVKDSIESIFDQIKNTALIHKTGGGTGFSFSHVRPKDDVVKSTGGIASGPISFIKVFDSATDVIKQGGKRRGANMGVLNVTHPDILDFIVCKEQEGTLSNFNISVSVSDNFMEAVTHDKDIELINPRTGEAVGKIKAKVIWNLALTMAWKNGEPGIIFLDRINTAHPLPSKMEATNPCGEQPLLPYESCNLGSINLQKMVTNGEVNKVKLAKTVELAVRFLDNVIDANKYPLEEIENETKRNRKIGLGVMGFANMLIKLGIPYGSEDSYEIAEEIMNFITETARKVSMKLGEERGSFPDFKSSKWSKKYSAMRNATVTTIAPTGTISVIAGCSSGIEPLFSLVFVRKVAESLGQDLIQVNSAFEEIAIKEGFYSQELISKLAKQTSTKDVEEIPEKWRKIFVTTFDITPEQHVRMQAAFQKYTDNAVSKTVNFPNSATPNDIEKVYMLAWKLGCKGITVYRDRSRDIQVLDRIEEPSECGVYCALS